MVEEDKTDPNQPVLDVKEEEWEPKWLCLVQVCTPNQQVHALIAMELDFKLQRKTSARPALEERFVKRRRFLNAMLRKVLQMVRGTHSMENLINIQIKKQAMLSYLLQNNHIKYFKERELIYSSKKPYLSKKLLQVVISPWTSLMDQNWEFKVQRAWSSSQICSWLLKIKDCHSTRRHTSSVISLSNSILISHLLSMINKWPTYKLCSLHRKDRELRTSRLHQLKSYWFTVRIKKILMPKVVLEEMTVIMKKMMIQEWEVDRESIANNNEINVNRF